MVEKRYNDDWAKTRSRDVVKGMIERTLLRFRRPEELEVLCFPGVDAQEIYEVYDRLQIPRGNVVGIERDSSVAEILEKKNLGIRLVRGSLEDYVSGLSSHSFDIVSLDYTGPLSSTQLQAITDLAKKQKRNHFVLNNCNLLRRDRTSYGLYYYGYVTAEPASGTGGEWHSAHYIAKRAGDVTRKLKNRESLKEEKDIAYSRLLNNATSYGSIKGANHLLRLFTGENYPAFLRICEEEMKSRFGLEVKIDDANPFGCTFGMGSYPIVTDMLDRITMLSMSAEFEAEGIYSASTQKILYLALIQAANYRKFFFPKRSERYSYISESGAPMIGDVCFLSFPSYLGDIVKNIAQVVGFPEKFKIRDYSSKEELVQLLCDYAKKWNKFNSGNFVRDKKVSERIFLGNSSKPVLTRGRAIEEFKNGAAIDDIKQRFRGWDGKPLAQWKAHVTMGTYDDKGEVDIQTGEITKEEVLDLIAAQIPIEEIHAAFPSSFSAGQLRAYKAHVSMGTYNNKEHLD